jgi:hypothetical protein
MMTLAEYVDGLAKAGTIDGNIAEMIMGLHRDETLESSVAVRKAIMPIVSEMDDYHEKCVVEVGRANDPFWDTHEPQTIGDFSDRLTDAVSNLCGELSLEETRKRLRRNRLDAPLDGATARADIDTVLGIVGEARRVNPNNEWADRLEASYRRDIDILTSAVKALLNGLRAVYDEECYDYGTSAAYSKAEEVVKSYEAEGGAK